MGLLGGMSLLNMNDMNETASPFDGDSMFRSAGRESNDGNDGKGDAAQSHITQRWETLAHMFHEIGLHRYIQRFDEERIDLAAAQLLGDGDLERMGLRLGDRLKLRAAVAQLGAVRLGSSIQCGRKCCFVSGVCAIVHTAISIPCFTVCASLLIEMHDGVLDRRRIMI